MKSLRKKPTFNELIYDLQHQPIIKYPARKGINILDDMMISNLLFDDEEWEEIMISDKATQTPYQKGTQTTNIFEKEVQTPDFRPKLDYEINPDKYYKIPSFSKRFNASRTGVRLTPNSAANLFSEIWELVGMRNDVIAAISHS
jgi:hypothetical protein